MVQIAVGGLWGIPCAGVAPGKTPGYENTSPDSCAESTIVD